MMETYKETVYRYIIERHDELPESHKAEYRIRGINPDDLWSLVWSFQTEEDALKCLEEEQERAAHFETYRMRDLGQTQHIERSFW